MPKFILTNDLHISRKNPSSRLDDFHAAMFSKLGQILNLALAVKANAILIAGDIFNEKTGVPFSLIFELWMWCLKVQRAGIRIISIPGNHDLRFDRYDSLPNQPLGLLYIGGAMEDVSFRILDVDGIQICGIPYPAAKHLDLYQKLPIPSSNLSILLSHCFATPEGGDYFGEPILSYQDLRKLPFNLFHFGHDHQDNGVHTIDSKHFVNIGALSRGSLSNENISRDVKCCLVETVEENFKITQVKLNYAPAADVFDLVLRERISRERTEIEQFVTDVADDLSEATTVNYRDKLDAMELTSEVRKRVYTYIETAEHAS